ncbi:DUF6328 family protein [Streptomyces sp. NPDC085614]|uniref:DUF6328 family protein n=1 Tax=Streptomyces sp. NPDC085614 TaxID=3365733 RepID=UPI0037D97197
MNNCQNMSPPLLPERARPFRGALPLLAATLLLAGSLLLIAVQPDFDQLGAADRALFTCAFTLSCAAGTGLLFPVLVRQVTQGSCPRRIRIRVVRVAYASAFLLAGTTCLLLILALPAHHLAWMTANPLFEQMNPGSHFLPGPDASVRKWIGIPYESHDCRPPARRGFAW